VLERRHMTRSFSERPIDQGVRDRVLRASLRAPTAGNTRGVAWVVLEGPVETSAYWTETTTDTWRRTSRRYEGLTRAPIVALSLANPEAYVERYGETDKAASGLGPPPLGGGAPAWPVPYWFGDAAFATLALLLGATEAGLGSCFLGNFRGERDLLASLSVPEPWRLFGSVLVGYPDGGDHRSASLDRPSPSDEQRIHHARWAPLAQP